MSIFSEERYQYSVSALEDSVVCMVKLDFIRSFSYETEVCNGLLTKISMINDKIISQTLDIRQKNLVAVCFCAALFYQRNLYFTCLDLPVSRKEIADFIGMSTANVIRTLSDFKKEGIIRVFGKTMKLLTLISWRSFRNVADLCEFIPCNSAKPLHMKILFLLRNLIDFCKSLLPASTRQLLHQATREQQNQNYTVAGTSMVSATS